MKKITTIILVLIIALTLAACGDNGGGNDNTPDERLTIDVDPYDVGSDPVLDPEPVNDESATNPEPTTTAVGDIIKFGGYDYDGLIYDWLVLDVKDGKALIICRDLLLRELPFHTEYVDITWENCSLRQYLNGEFYNSFSESDSERIIETTVVNADNPEYGTDGGNDTTDRIFLLSIDEAQIYLADVSARMAVNQSGETNWYWLRSPGAHNKHFAFVQCIGGDDDIHVSGTVIDGSLGVRPAMWITKED